MKTEIIAQPADFVTPPGIEKEDEEPDDENEQDNEEEDNEEGKHLPSHHPRFWTKYGNQPGSDHFLGTVDSSPLNFRTNNLERMSILPGGNISITHNLFVGDTITSGILEGRGPGLLKTTAGGAIYRFPLTGDSGDVLRGDGTFGNYSDNDWKVDNNTLYSIPSGNVGIGTETPTSKLEVNGKITSGNIKLTELAGAEGMLTVNGKGNVYSKTFESDTFTFYNMQTENLHVKNNFQIGNTIYANVDSAAEENYIYTDQGDDLFIQHPPSDTVSPAHLILGYSTGAHNVGVKTASPQYDLDVNGDINFSGDLLKNGKNPGLWEGSYKGGWQIEAAGVDIGDKHYEGAKIRVNATTKSSGRYPEAEGGWIRIIPGETSDSRRAGAIFMADPMSEEYVQIANGKLHINHRIYDDLSQELFVNGDATITGDLDVNGSIPRIWEKTDNGIYYQNKKVCIGTNDFSNDGLLNVNGKINAEEIEIKQVYPADFIFKENYKLTGIDSLAAYIDQEGHLPDMPSAEEMKENGIDLAKMNGRLLQKIEELTLYTIQQQKRIKDLAEKNKKLKEQNEKINEVMKEIENLKAKMEE